MRHLYSALVFCAAVVAAPTPRHLIGANPLTAPNGREARVIGYEFTAKEARQAGLTDAAVAGLYLSKEFKTDHNGVTHLRYRQQFQGLDVYNAAWSVNVDSDGRILNAGGQLYNPPDRSTGTPNFDTAGRSVQAALDAVDPLLTRRAKLIRKGANAAGAMRFSVGQAEDITARPVWFPVHDTLQPAWMTLVTATDDVSTYEVLIHAESEAVFAKNPLTFFQNPAPRGQVFTSISPQPPVKIGVASNDLPPYVSRELVPFGCVTS